MVVLFNYKNGRLVLLSVFLLSLSVETLQYVFRVGVADIDDVLLNTAGGWAGVWVYLALQKKIGLYIFPLTPGK
jgi:glycopeptide antibiotics resistance protein